MDKNDLDNYTSTLIVLGLHLSAHADLHPEQPELATAVAHIRQAAEALSLARRKLDE